MIISRRITSIFSSGFKVVSHLIIPWFTVYVENNFMYDNYRVFQKSVQEPSSLGAAYYSEVSIYSKVAAKAVS